MELHAVRVYPATAGVPREAQLAWKIAAVSADPVAVEPALREQFLRAVQALEQIPGGELHQLNVTLPEGTLAQSRPGIF